MNAHCVLGTLRMSLVVAGMAVSAALGQTTFQISDVAWDKEYDFDTDGYSSAMLLSVDPDVSSGTEKVLLDLYYRESSATTWNLFLTSDTLTITGTATVYYSFNIEGSTRGTYDYRIVMREALSGLQVDQVLPIDFAALNDHDEETAAQDNAAGDVFTLYDMYWENELDYDVDGYVSAMSLMVDPDYNGDTATVYLRFHYKLSTASTYTLFDTSPDILIRGSLPVYYQMDLTPSPHGRYDYRVELVDAATDLVVDVLDATTAAVLNDHAEESPAEDLQTIEVYSAAWERQIDTDGDGYYSSMDLVVDPDASGESRQVYAELSFRPNQSTSAYTAFSTSDTFTIVEDNTDRVVFTVTPSEHGRYDYRVRILDANTDEVLATATSVDHTILGAHPEESPFADGLTGQRLSIADARWGNVVDPDGDGYASAMDLEFDPDVTTGSATIYVVFYYKPSAQSTFAAFDTSVSIAITGITTQYYSIGVLPSPHGSYDYAIEIRDNVTDEVLAWCGPQNDPSLNDHLEETPAEESASAIVAASPTHRPALSATVSNGTLFASVNLPGANSAQLSLYDTRGARVWHDHRVTLTAGQASLRCAMKLATGTYLLTLASEGQRLSQVLAIR